MKSFKEYLAELNVPGTYGDETGNYSVSEIISRATGMSGRTQKMRVSRLIDKNREVSTSEGPLGANIDKPNPEFLARSEKSDTSYPIHINPQGWIVDGSHRLAKLHRQGKKYADVKVVGPKVLKKSKK